MLKEDFDSLEVGDWCFINGESYIGIRMGEEEMDCCILPIAKNDEHFIDQYGKCSWSWNGNKEAPSLTPSILHWGHGRKNPATWHGFLTDGKLVEV